MVESTLLSKQFIPKNSILLNGPRTGLQYKQLGPSCVQEFTYLLRCHFPEIGSGNVGYFVNI